MYSSLSMSTLIIFVNVRGDTRRIRQRGHRPLAVGQCEAMPVLTKLFGLTHLVCIVLAMCHMLNKKQPLASQWHILLYMTARIIKRE